MEEKKENVELVDPSSIPVEDRLATISIVWTKDGKVFMSQPSEAHLTIKMLSVALSTLADNLLKISNLAKQKPQTPAIVPARTNQIPPFDPRFIRKG